MTRINKLMVLVFSGDLFHNNKNIEYRQPSHLIWIKQCMFSSFKWRILSVKKVIMHVKKDPFDS